MNELIKNIWDKAYEACKEKHCTECGSEANVTEMSFRPGNNRYVVCFYFECPECGDDWSTDLD